MMLFVLLLATAVNTVLVESFTTLRPQRVTTITKTFLVSRPRLQTPSALLASSSLSDASKNQYEFALLFDCDGVILETEELHRLAYNAAFRKFGLTIQGEPVEWTVEYYDILQNTVGGGKPKMWYYFSNTTGTFPMVGDVPAPVTVHEQQQLIDMLQDYKTDEFKRLLETEAKARPGVLELMDAALADPTIAVGVCSAATKAAAIKTLDITLGPNRVSQLDVCILGDDVPAKKPDPMIYNVARERLGISAQRCVVIEDSLVGLRAAVRANMKCIITYTSSTATADFYGEGAKAKVPDLASAQVTLDSIFEPLRQHGLDADLLVGRKDPVTVVAV